ncbi:MAG: hypothetical protein JO055_10470 [Alphaproteobacteria bacterium]|nr:hypothetical protein [Alphaproteobacteria bacterium]
MSDSDPEWLLDRAHTARAEAARMLERARALSSESERAELIRFAAKLEQRAKDLEQRAGRQAERDDHA